MHSASSIPAGTINNLVDILTSPGEAFQALKERPTFLVPLLAVILSNVALIFWYYSQVDYVWLIETTIAQQDLPDDVREQIVENAADASPMVTGSLAAAAASVMVLLMLALMAAYLVIVSFVTNDGYRFKHWFSLVSWSSIPIVVAMLASTVNLAVSESAHLPQQELNPLSFANLLALDVSGGGLLAGVLQAVDLTSVWALGLMVIGYRTWTGKSLGSSFLTVAAPLLVIVAVSILFAVV